MSGEWGVWCQVSGGVTGTREAWLKSNGEIQLFDSEDAARAEARRLMERIGRFGQARFNYTARQFDPWE